MQLLIDGVTNTDAGGELKQIPSPAQVALMNAGPCFLTSGMLCRAIAHAKLMPADTTWCTGQDWFSTQAVGTNLSYHSELQRKCGCASADCPTLISVSTHYWPINQDNPSKT
jgi:hypothetical protein